MGTKLAPSFANLFMGYFEDKFIYSYRLQPLLWKRFIDDIFFIWTHGEDELLTFVQHLNDCHQTIKFTLETSLRNSVLNGEWSSLGWGRGGGTRADVAGRRGKYLSHVSGSMGCGQVDTLQLRRYEAKVPWL